MMPVGTTWLAFRASSANSLRGFGAVRITGTPQCFASSGPSRSMSTLVSCLGLPNTKAAFKCGQLDPAREWRIQYFRAQQLDQHDVVDAPASLVSPGQHPTEIGLDVSGSMVDRKS